MRFSFVGMSGVGKSFWAKRLAERGFVRHDCDGEIAKHLGELVASSRGSDDEEPVHAIGRWMGMPWSDGYSAREARYLDLEERVTRAALDAAGDRDVIDTTGSVVYLGTALLEELRRRTRVVHLRTATEQRAALLRRYLREPKPVVWGNAFVAAAGEPAERALPRCFEALLEERDSRYRALAHVEIDGSALEREGSAIDAFLDRIGR